MLLKMALLHPIKTHYILNNKGGKGRSSVEFLQALCFHKDESFDCS